MKGVEQIARTFFTLRLSAAGPILPPGYIKYVAINISGQHILASNYLPYLDKAAVADDICTGLLNDKASRRSLARYSDWLAIGNGHTCHLHSLSIPLAACLADSDK